VLAPTVRRDAFGASGKLVKSQLYFALFFSFTIASVSCNEGNEINTRDLAVYASELEKLWKFIYATSLAVYLPLFHSLKKGQ